ncbi:MAG: hypothetical protein LBE33_01605 [Zoogloeaceae bacterium]|jgi:hypothetical protein|nr:hypothetical protein [Zoogloeaceae bacterium]
MLWALMEDEFFNRASWQAMLNREGMPPSSASIGLLRRQDFAARRGTLLLWRSDAAGCRADLREYSGTPGDDVAILLVADDKALATVQEDGWQPLPILIRQGRLHPYMLKTLDELEEAGLAGFVEDLGLVFPKH